MLTDARLGYGAATAEAIGSFSKLADVLMRLEEMQAALRAEGLDGWLFFDHHRRDPLAYRVLQFAPNSPVTRRWFYYVPADGEPQIVFPTEARYVGEHGTAQSTSSDRGGSPAAADRRGGAPRGHAVFAERSGAVGFHGGRGYGGVGAWFGSRGGHLGQPHSIFRIAMDAGAVGQPSGSGAEGRQGPRGSVRPRGGEAARARTRDGMGDATVYPEAVRRRAW